MARQGRNKPLTNAEVRRRIDASPSGLTAQINGASVRYTYLSQRGYYPDGAFVYRILQIKFSATLINFIKIRFCLVSTLSIYVTFFTKCHKIFLQIYNSIFLCFYLKKKLNHDSLPRTFGNKILALHPYKCEEGDIIIR